MLTYEALVEQYPMLKAYPRDKVEFWANLAPHAIAEPRFAERDLERARQLYVVHSVVDTHARPIVDMNEREVGKAIPAHSAPPPPATPDAARRVRAMTGWGRTIHGRQLFAMQRG